MVPKPSASLRVDRNLEHRTRNSKRPEISLAMATTFFDRAAEPKVAANPLGIKGIDHIEFIVDDADQWRDFFVEKYGMTTRFYGDESTGVKGRRAHVVGQGR